MRRAVLYARESPSLAENELTVDSQVDAVAKRIKEDNNLLIENYIDNGWAGDLLARPALDKLRDDAVQRKFEVVYIFDRDRLARLYWLQALVIDELTDSNIEVVFLKEPKIESDEDRIIFGIRGLFSEYERAKIKERTRRGRLFRAKQGLLVGHEAPYGYRYIKKDNVQERHYEIVESEAKIVKLIFHLLAYEKITLRGIIKRLYELKITPKNGKETWANSTLSRLVRREDYIGKAYYNKSYTLIPTKVSNEKIYKRTKKTSRKYKSRDEWLPVEIPAIIDKETFFLAQDQLKNNQLLSPRNIKRSYILRGLLYCNKCKSKYTGEASQNYKHYRSTLRLKTFPQKPNCKCISVNGEMIENLVWSEISELLSNPELIKAHYQKWEKSKERNIFNDESKLLELNIQIDVLNKAEKRLIDGYTAGVITLDQLKVRLSEIKLNKSKLEQSKSNLDEDKSSYKAKYRLNPEVACAEFKKELDITNEKEKEQILHAVVKEILIEKYKAIIRGYLPLYVEANNELRSNLYNRRSSK